MGQYAFPRYTCFACGRSCQMAAHVYEGVQVPGYGVFACDGCHRGNVDGWGPACEATLLAHMRQHAIPIPARNARGWLPREYSSPAIS
jgi:hypothetical protein